MSLLPSYRINESALVDVEKALMHQEIVMKCTKEKYLQSDKVTMYEEWEVKTKEGIRLIMWGQHPAERLANSTSINLTFSTPDGKRGIKLLDLTEKTVTQFGGQKIS